MNEERKFNAKPIFFDDINDTFDEHGNTFLAMRRTQWLKEGETPDKDKSKIELRKWRVTSEGERADKGFSFLTEEGPNQLVNTLIKNGFGDTKEILIGIRKRDNFKESVEHLFDKEDFSTDGEYFDMRTMLLADEPDIEDEDDDNESE